MAARGHARYILLLVDTVVLGVGRADDRRIAPGTQRDVVAEGRPLARVVLGVRLKANSGDHMYVGSFEDTTLRE